MIHVEGDRKIISFEPLRPNYNVHVIKCFTESDNSGDPKGTLTRVRSTLSEVLLYTCVFHVWNIEAETKVSIRFLNV